MYRFRVLEIRLRIRKKEIEGIFGCKKGQKEYNTLKYEYHFGLNQVSKFEYRRLIFSLSTDVLLRISSRSSPGDSCNFPICSSFLAN